jgi:CheY-like chemotaxis protein
MPSILVVDDTRSTCTALAAILGREGHSVVTATSGDEALAYLETAEIDLVWPKYPNALYCHRVQTRHDSPRLLNFTML